MILSSLEEKAGRLEQARMYQARGIRLWREWTSRGRSDERVDVCVLTDLAEALWKREARKEAVAAVERLVAAMERGRPALDARWIPALQAAARILRKEHRGGEARELERRAREITVAKRSELAARGHRVDLLSLRQGGR